MIVPRRGRTVPFRYLLFYKPFGVLTQFSPPVNTSPDGVPKRTLSDFIHVPGVYPVGRLDFDSEGLLLLTDDGELQHRLSHPRFEHPRTYWVQVEGQITLEAISQLRRGGLAIQDYRTKACKAQIMEPPPLPPREPPVRVRKLIPTSWLELTLREGKNRQVRHMTAAVGFPTLRLVRVQIGCLTIKGLAPGRWRYLNEAELQQLREQCGQHEESGLAPKPKRRPTRSFRRYR